MFSKDVMKDTFWDSLLCCISVYIQFVILETKHYSFLCGGETKNKKEKYNFDKLTFFATNRNWYILHKNVHSYRQILEKFCKRTCWKSYKCGPKYPTRCRVKKVINSPSRLTIFTDLPNLKLLCKYCLWCNKHKYVLHSDSHLY